MWLEGTQRDRQVDDDVYEGISRGDGLKMGLGRRRTRRVACQMRRRFKRDHESQTKELKDKEAGIKNENQTRAVRTCLQPDKNNDDAGIWERDVYR